MYSLSLFEPTLRTIHKQLWNHVFFANMCGAIRQRRVPDNFENHTQTWTHDCALSWDGSASSVEHLQMMGWVGRLYSLSSFEPTFRRCRIFSHASLTSPGPAYLRSSPSHFWKHVSLSLCISTRWSVSGADANWV